MCHHQGPRLHGVLGRCRLSRSRVFWLFGVLFAATLPAHGQDCSWTLRGTAGPAARSGHAMVYDSARGCVVLFGGFNGTTRLGDTWEWDGTTWTERATTGPTPRVLGPGMAYDSTRQRTVLFGGFDGAYRNDTWEWNGTSWTQRLVTGPTARNGHAMAFDSQRGRIVLFGGGGGAADTWEWDGSVWTQRLVNGPSGRGGHTMVYDSTRGRVVLFGGRYGSAYRSDTWEWDGTDWTQVATSGPSARYQHMMAFSGAEGRALLFGGYFFDTVAHYYADTWEWDGAAWTQRVINGPPARNAHAMTYDVLRDCVVLFGGVGATTLFGDTSVWTCTSQAFQTEIVEGYLVTAPNGNQLWTKIIQPRAALYPGQRFPAVVSVPGGLGAGEGGNANVASSGFVEFHFNAEGRGTAHPSGGVENHNGFIHQDDLRAVIEFAYSRTNVQTDNLGVATGSYGITMGAGCLGRYPGLPVKYLVDGEGPCDSYVTSFEPWSLDGDSSNDKIQTAYQMFGHYSLSRDPSPANQAWWTEREATRYIGSVRCRYLRIQAQWDHAQPPNAQWPTGWDYQPLWYPCKHAIDMINLATLGRSEWTRVNHSTIGNAACVTYDHDQPPVYYSGRMTDHQGETARIIQEMASAPARHGDLNRDGYINLLDLDGFVAVLLGLDTNPDRTVIADMKGDGIADGLDIQGFIDVITTP
jgi:hypothetical protein